MIVIDEAIPIQIFFNQLINDKKPHNYKTE